MSLGRHILGDLHMLARSVSYWDESMERMLHPHILVKPGLGPTWCLTAQPCARPHAAAAAPRPTERLSDTNVSLSHLERTFLIFYLNQVKNSRETGALSEEYRAVPALKPVSNQQRFRWQRHFLLRLVRCTRKRTRI